MRVKASLCSLSNPWWQPRVFRMPHGPYLPSSVADSTSSRNSVRWQLSRSSVSHSCLATSLQQSSGLHLTTASLISDSSALWDLTASTLTGDAWLVPTWWPALASTPASLQMAFGQSVLLSQLLTSHTMAPWVSLCQLSLPSAVSPFFDFLTSTI